MSGESTVDIVIRANDKTSDGVGSAKAGFAGLGKVGAAAMTGIGAAVAGVAAGLGVFASKLGEAMNIEAANDKLKAQLGLTAQQSEAFGRAAGQLYSQAYGDSIGGVNEALRFVQQNIGDAMGNADDALQTTTATAMNFAKAFDEDVSQATRAAGVMLKTGLASNAQEAFDVLTVGMQNGANAGDDLLDTFSEYSPKFQEVGVSAESAMGMISQAMKAGARDSDFVADAIKEFAIRAKDGSKTSAEAFQALGLDADRMFKTFAEGGPAADAAMGEVTRRLRDMKDPVKQNEAAVALFGTKAEDLGHSLYAIDPTTAVSALGEVGGAAQRMGDDLNNNAATKLETFKRTMQQGLTDFMTNTVLPGIVGFAERVSTALGPGLDAARQTWDTFVKALRGEGEAPTWMQPIVDMVNNLKTKFEEFRPQLESFINDVLKKLAEWWPTIEAALRSAYDNAIVPFFNFVGENSEQIKNFAVTLGVVAAVIVGSVIVAFVAMVGAVGLVVAAAVGLVIGIQHVIQVLWDLFNNARDALGFVIDKIEEVIQFFWDLVQNIGSAIADAVRAVWGFFGGVNDMANNLASKIDEIIGWFIGLPGRILGAIGDLAGLLVDSGRKLLEGLWNGINEKVGWLKDKVGGVLSSVRNLFPFSPAKEGPFSGRGYTTYSGQALMDDFARGAASRAASTAAAISGALAGAAGATRPGLPGGGFAGVAPAAVSVNINFSGDVDSVLANGFMKMIRTGQIQIAASQVSPNGLRP